MQTSLPRASIADTLAFATDVLVPTLAKGVIIRRPRMVAMAERMGLDSRAVRRLQLLKVRYGDGPLMLRIPGREQAVILSPDDVKRVLDTTPEPFATDSPEKRAALSHFEPRGVLISHGPVRTERRRFNESALESNHARHRLAERFAAVVEEEAAHILNEARRSGQLTWDLFVADWFRVVRRVVLGDSAASDRELTDLLARLRADANWAFMRPKRNAVRQRFFARLTTYIERAEPGSLASIVAALPATPSTAPVDQVPQWLFAFDAAGMALYRALALLSSHADYRTRAREEIAASAGIVAPPLLFLRASVLESVRLWPTTPMILRQTTAATTWARGTMPARAGVLIFVPFFHRDETRLAFAHRFTPEAWLGAAPAEEWPLIPFSAGPGVCPGQQLVLLLTSMMLAHLLGGRALHLDPPARLDATRPLPGTLDNFSLRFTIDP